MRKVIETWAIEYKYESKDDGCMTGFLSYSSVGILLPHFVSGNDTALFKTRQYARDIKTQLANRHFRVVPVKVTIESQGDKNGVRV